MIKNIVFLHGLAGSKAGFIELENLVARDPRVQTYAFDLLGFGENSTAIGEFTIEEHRAHITKKIQERFSNQSVTLIGYSMGGVLALDWTLHNQSQVQKLILIATPLPENAKEARKAITYGESSKLNWGYFILNHPWFSFFSCKILCRLNFMRFFKFLKPAYISDQIFKDYHLHSWNSLKKSFYSTVINYPAVDVISKITITPILNIVASQDNPLMRKHPNQSNVKTVEINGNHHLLLTQTKKVYELIKEFVS
jgi:pimeloyl-ACP methyl ester carboxylesterase